MTLDARAYIRSRCSDSPEECWVWALSLCGKGYGQCSFEGRRWMAHRLAYVAFVGPIPKGMFVCHTCDNPACCNPGHLFLGTNQDNVDDMKAKLRHRHGDSHHNAKLTDEQVRAIRRLRGTGVLQREVAQQFSVSQSYVSGVWSGKIRPYLMFVEAK